MRSSALLHLPRRGVAMLLEVGGVAVLLEVLRRVGVVVPRRRRLVAIRRRVLLGGVPVGLLTVGLLVRRVPRALRRARSGKVR